MAKNISPIRPPFAPLYRVANLYLSQTLLDIQVNMQVQRIYPTEVYKGYSDVNRQRKEKGMWYSTGEGVNSFERRIYQADEDRGLLTVGVLFNDYLRYVDIGVGLTGNPLDPDAHITADKVDRQKRASFNSRYINKWNRRHGKSHRPAILRSIRRLGNRYEKHLADYYGYQGAIYIINAFEGMGRLAITD